MAEYQAKSINTLSFDVTKDGRSAGKLAYKAWFKFNAVIETADHATYQVEPKGFWGTTIEVKEHGKVLLQFKMNWSGEIVIQTFFNHKEEGYLFKHKGFFKDSYTLTDMEGREFLIMKPHMKWSRLSYEYHINTTDSFEQLAHKNLLLINSLHCVNYYLSMMMSAVG